MTEQVRSFKPLRPLSPVILPDGPHVEHNMPCAVCLQRHAVYHMNEGIFHPCWWCQYQGWEIRVRPWWVRLWQKVRGTDPVRPPGGAPAKAVLAAKESRDG